STARERLHRSLLKRGVGLSSVALGAVRAGKSSAGSHSELTNRTLHAVMEFTRTGSAAGAVSSHVLSIVAGVANTMTANKMPLVAALAVSLCGWGGGGTVNYAAQEGRGGKPPPAGVDTGRGKKAKEKEKPPAAVVKTEPSPALPAPPAEVLHAKLRKPAGLTQPLDQMPLKELLEFLSDRFEVPIRIDLAAFARLNSGANVTAMYDSPIRLPVVRGMSVGDVLNDALAQIALGGGDGAPGLQCAYRVRDGQILIVPAYHTPYSSVGSGPPPGANEGEVAVDTRTFLEQTEGEPI